MSRLALRGVRHALAFCTWPIGRSLGTDQLAELTWEMSRVPSASLAMEGETRKRRLAGSE